MSRAEDLYRRVLDGHVAAIDEFIATRRSEELFLDFKRSSTNGAGQHLSDNDRNNFARAISGFGNSEGGILVWGVDCSNDTGGADVAQYKVPLEDALKFASWLQGAISGCTIPPHQNVQITPIVAGPGHSGFVASLIPRSNHAPHQVVGRLQYFMRAGSNFVPVPHAVLAGMFGRVPQPNVFHNFLVGMAEVEDGAVSATCGLMLVNSGPGIAADLFANLMVLSHPGPNCEIAFDRPDATNWGGIWSFGRQMSLISQPGYRLPPDSYVQPLIIHMKVSPPFDAPFRIKGIVGAGTSVPHRLELRQEPQRIQAIFDEFMQANATGTLTNKQRHRFAPLVLGVSEDLLSDDDA